MDRNRDIVAEREVVEHVDGEEQCDAREPSYHGNSSGSEEEGRMGGREVGGPCEQGRYGKLNKGDKETYIDSREESPLGPVCCLGGGGTELEGRMEGKGFSPYHYRVFLWG